MQSQMMFEIIPTYVLLVPQGDAKAACTVCVSLLFLRVIILWQVCLKICVIFYFLYVIILHKYIRIISVLLWWHIYHAITIVF